MPGGGKGSNNYGKRKLTSLCCVKPKTSISWKERAEKKWEGLK